MKIIWEPKDIKPGRRYSRQGIGETWIIGYLPYETGADRYVSVSDTDGLVTPQTTAEDLATSLTSAGYVPVELLAALTEAG